MTCLSLFGPRVLSVRVTCNKCSTYSTLRSQESEITITGTQTAWGGQNPTRGGRPKRPPNRLTSASA